MFPASYSEASLLPLAASFCAHSKPGRTLDPCSYAAERLAQPVRSTNQSRGGFSGGIARYNFSEGEVENENSNSRARGLASRDISPAASKNYPIHQSY